MNKTAISSFVESNQKIESFTPVGFDLRVKTAEGKEFIIENAVTEILVGEYTLPLSNGSLLDFDKVMESIPDIELSFNVYYLEDIFSSAEVANKDIKEVSELKARYEKVQKLLSDLEQKIKDKDEKLSEKQQELEKSNLSQQEIAEQKKQIEEHAAMLESQLEQIEAAKIQGEESSAEKLREELQAQEESPTLKRPSVAQQTSPPEDSDSGGEEQAEMLEQVLESLKASLFVTGGLDDNSDTGKKGSGYTNLASPTLEGTTLANLNVNILISGTVYTVKADANGKWSFTLPNALANATYEYEISVQDQEGKSESLTGTITVDTTVPPLTDVNWKNDALAKDTINIVNESKPQLTGISSAGATITLTIEGKTYKTIADEEGKWTIIVMNALPDGE